MSFDPEKITFFAKTDARGGQVPFGIKARDRQRHMYVVGKTGMGKSTLLENMAAQDIQNGEGMAFIDPHGSAAETLLDYVPEHRVNDVIYFAPFDLANPISFNVMEDVGPDKRHLVVSGLMSTFKKIWVDAWSARMEYILTNALLALIEYPDTTLLSVNRLFSDKAYRNQVVAYIKDPAVKAFWTEEFANYTDRFAAEALPAIQNKIGQFTGNPLIRNIIGQPHSSFDIRKIMDEKKILIMNLSKGLVGETNANLLGSMLTTRIYLAAMSRADLPVEQMRTMPNFYFYVDEFQSFANATFANILSEARKYHLNLIIAHQYIAQMEEEVRDAVFGNVGTTVAFRVGPFDAEVLETVFTPRFLAADLVNLGFAQIYLTLMIDGIGSQPFSAVTLPPVEHPHVSCKDMVIAASRRNYTKSREVVEDLVMKLHTPVVEEKPPAKKKPEVQNNARPIEQRPAEKRSDMSQRSERFTPVPTSIVPPSSKSPIPTAYTGNERRSEEGQTNPRANFLMTERRTERAGDKPSAVPATQRQNERLEVTRTDLPISERRADRPENRHKDTPNGEHRSDRPRFDKPREEKRHSDRPALADLKAVLASISAGENKKPTDNKIEQSDIKPKSEGGENKAPVAKAELASVLAKVTSANGNTIQPNHSALVTKLVVQEKRNNTLSQKQETSEIKADTAVAKAELARMVAETEEAFKNLENSAPPADDPLAPKKIEKMFRQPSNERSPFAT